MVLLLSLLRVKTLVKLSVIANFHIVSLSFRSNKMVVNTNCKELKTYTPFTPAKHVLLNWFSLNENYKQSTEKLDFPLDSSTC